jgi:hypothetical protein
MLRIFSRTVPAARSTFKTQSQLIPKTSYQFVSNMAPGKANNEELKGSKLFDVSHVTALVTGGGTGIGLMITQALVANGAKVYITSRREEVLKKTDELYNSGPGQIIPLVGDVRLVTTEYMYKIEAKLPTVTRRMLHVSTRSSLRRSQRASSFLLITQVSLAMITPSSLLLDNRTWTMPSRSHSTSSSPSLKVGQTPSRPTSAASSG